jgi:hypothetical protein
LGHPIDHPRILREGAVADVLEAINQEIGEAEAALAYVPEFTRYQGLLKLRADYLQLLGVGDTKSVPTVLGPRQVLPVRIRVRKPASPEREALLNDIDRLLEGVTAPMRTSEIYDLVSLVHEIGGEEPRSNLSAIMHNSKRFQSHGRRGWTQQGVAVSTPNEPEEYIGDVI